MTVTISGTASRQTARQWPLPADREPSVLGGMDDLQLLAIVGSLPRGSERRDAACQLLVVRYRGLVLCAAVPVRSRAG